MLDFNVLLKQVGIDPAQTLIVRHFPQEAPLRRALPRLVLERPDLWIAYQQIQWRTLEQAMLRAQVVASFIGQEAGRATFAGLYGIGPHRTLDHAGYCSFPGNAELEKRGMSGRTVEMGDCLAFELEPLDHFNDWVGRMTIVWPMPHQSWWRWAGRASFAVHAIEAENRFVPPRPEWRRLVLRWDELKSLPGSWSAALSQWRGIYYIYDVSREAGYVGSACGADNIHGRWCDYARSGHGGNRKLRDSRPEDLRFSILELTSPDLEPADVIGLETSWKERLHTREFGLNSN